MKVNEIVAFMKNKGQNIKKIKGATDYLTKLEEDFTVSIPKDIKTYISLSHDIKDVHGIITAFDDEGEDSYISLIAQTENEPFAEYRRIWELYKELITEGYLPIGFFKDAGPLCVDMKRNQEIVFIDEDSKNGGEEEPFYRTVIASSFEELLEIYFGVESDEVDDGDDDTDIEEISAQTEAMIAASVVRNEAEFEEALLQYKKWFPNSSYGAVSCLMNVEKADVRWDEALIGLDNLIEQYKDYQYTRLSGSNVVMEVLGNTTKDLYVVNMVGKEKIFSYVLEDVWKKYYEEQIKYPEVLFQMLLGLHIYENDTDFGKKNCEIAKELYGSEFAVIREYKYSDLMGHILKWYLAEFCDYYRVFQLCWVVLDYLNHLDDFDIEISSGPIFDLEEDENNIVPVYSLYSLCVPICIFRNYLEENMQCHDVGLGAYEALMEKTGWLDLGIDTEDRYYTVSFGVGKLYFSNYLVATLRESISREYLENIFPVDGKWNADYCFDKGESLASLCEFMEAIEILKNKSEEMDEGVFEYREALALFKKVEDKMMLDEFHDKVETIYKEYMDALIDGELKRGKGKSNYSEGACSISSLYGTEYAVKILKAIPEVGIVKSKAKSAAKKAVWNHLLRVSKPGINEDKFTIKDIVSASGVSQDLINEWLDVAPIWKDYLL